jgi:glyoxylase-like metal-dependent hydrolase (beta-lactamase superfamily II)
MISGHEFEHWNSTPEADRASRAVVMFDASVTPLFEHGVAELVAVDQVINDQLRLIPTPGHSPGHVCVLITSGGKRALITGDCVHSPVQFAEPDWYAGIDVDPPMSCTTRRRLIADYADTDVLVIGTHFAPPTAGYIVRAAGSTQFVPLDAGRASLDGIQMIDHVVDSRSEG